MQGHGYKSLVKSSHSDIIRQLFGKTSASFIGIFIFSILFHLLWVYGALYDHVTVGQFDSFPFYLIRADSIQNESSNVVKFTQENHRTEYGSFQITALRPHCQLLNLKNYLPLFVMSFDLFVLLLIGIAQFVTSLLLIQRYYKQRTPMKKSKSTQKNLLLRKNPDEPSLHSNYKPLNVTVVIYLSVFSLVFAMPSVITRNILMNIIMGLKIFSIKPSELPSSSVASGHNMNFVDFNQTFNTTSSDLVYTSPANDTDMHVDEGYSLERDFVPLINSLLTQLDYLLLIASSHKFLIFLFNCNLVSLPFNLFKSKVKRKSLLVVNGN